MPAPKLPTRYPDAFRSLFERAQAGESITVPSTNPQSMRGKLYAYARALRLDGQPELADSVHVRVVGNTVVVESRHHSPEAREIAAALAQSGPGPQGPVMAGESLFERLAK